MWLILAHANDLPARTLAHRWAGRAVLRTPAELCRDRWTLELDPEGTVRTSTTGEPAAVVSRLGVVTAADLPGVHPDDRSYAAAELTAFLMAWLDACPAPVLNRPTAGSLNGPPWHAEQWAAAAESVGLRPAPIRRRVGGPSRPEPLWHSMIYANVVGDWCLRDVHPAVGERLCALGRLAGTPLLGAAVSGPGRDARVRDICAWPDLGVPAVADALAKTLDLVGVRA
ncbi:hypothetical protein [Actinophytocola sp.]|uniref:hypothetical protein n=1 Tax=Actinophytocola sp. TaxID=1872138 RepID=UPI002D7E8CBE|nr:hypothetical protein [Actinophytocola sp.]HET9141630.1 hypothetical protein [Actinophytocola sp.]